MNDVINAPDWIEVDDWIASNTEYGDLIEHDWLQKQFHLEKPEYGKAEVFDKFNFDYMQYMSNMSKYLLEEHALALQNVRGKGYRVVPPCEQIGIAKKQAKNELHRAVSRYASHLQYIRYEELPSHEQRRRDDEAAKLSQMRQMMRRSLSDKP